jgi:hypothetical protein
MKNKDFVGYEEALGLKEIGFDEPCFGRYNNNDDYLLIAHTEKYIISNGVDRSEFFTLAPLYSQAFRWFREKYGYYFQPFVDDNQTFGYLITYFTDEGRIDKPIKRAFKTPEESELFCLRQLIEILKEKNK